MATKRLKTTKDKVRGAQQRAKALALRTEGLPYREIGTALGITLQRAQQLVMEELDRLALVRLSNAGDLRRMELERLEAAAVPVLAKLKKGDMKAALVWIKLSESRRKLLGLDAPVKIAPTDPDGNPLPAAHDLSKLSEQELEALAALVAKSAQQVQG